MTIEVMTLITVISLTVGIVSTLLNLRRNSKVDAKTTIIETANLNNKIDNVLNIKVATKLLQRFHANDITAFENGFDY